MKRNESLRQKPDWFVIMTLNGAVCSVCGKPEYPFLNGICHSFTKGLNTHYSHPEFELIIDLDQRQIMGILNNLGYMVRDGRRFHDGDIVEGVCTSIPIKLIKSPDSAKLRVVFPDQQGRWPEDEGCEELFRLQKLPLSALESGSAHTH